MSGERVSEVGERALIDWIRRAADAAAREVAADASAPIATFPSGDLGIGDDCAVVTPTPGRRLVLEVDDAVEGVHFRLDWMAPEDVGHRLATQALSDLAAMGAVPRWALLSLALPSDLRVEVMRGMVRGCVRQLARCGARLVGGNLTSTAGPLRGSLTAVGEVEPARVLRRQGARFGDAVFLTGEPGLARAGWMLLERGLVGGAPLSGALLSGALLSGESVSGTKAALARYRRPEPRIGVGRRLSGSRAVSAAIDLSDGLSEGARDLAGASGVRLELDASLVPLSDSLREAARRLAEDPLRLALAGGDDFELLVTGDEAALRAVGEEAGWPEALRWTRIGQVMEGEPGVSWPGAPAIDGWASPSYVHFGGHGENRDGAREGTCEQNQARRP